MIKTSSLRLILTTYGKLFGARFSTQMMRLTANTWLFRRGTILTISGLETDRVMVKKSVLHTYASNKGPILIKDDFLHLV
jgi:hypothetical protein